MRAHLEVWKSGGPELVVLDAERVTAGKAGSSDISVSGDRRMSRLHAVFERYAGGWCVRDLGSRNGTFVNGERIWAERALHSGDEMRLGNTRFVFRTDEPARTPPTEVSGEPPNLTRRERDVLIELCRPVLSGDVFTEPASIREIAGALFISEPGVKQHLAHLYEKFGTEEGERRRVRLANEAIRRGAVGISDLRTTGAAASPEP